MKVPLAPAVRAALWMSGALLAFATMAVAGRELAGELSPFQVILFRNVVACVALAVCFGATGWHRTRTARFATHCRRNLLHFLGGCGWFYGLGHLPLAEVFALEFTVPVWTALLATRLLGERLSAARRIAVVCGLGGAWLILRPGFAAVSPAALAVLAGAVAYAGSFILTKRLAASDPPATVLFYMSVIQLPLALLPSLIDWRMPSAAAWPWLVAVGLTMLAAHLCITRALALADVTVVVPLDFLRLPLIAGVGFLLYGETLDWWVLAGATLMVAGNVWSLRHEAGASARHRVALLSEGGPDEANRGGA
jgi:drug/metabolite transporter (DMT)-like permease